MADYSIDSLKAFFRSKKWDGSFTAGCPEHSKPTAGVGITIRQPGTITTPELRAQASADAYLSGRINIKVCHLGGKCGIYVMNVYGWTNGSTCTPAAARTDALFAAGRGELRELPPLPCLICGDINANTKNLPSLVAMLNDGWTDVGHQSHWRGGTDNQPTCQAPNNLSSPSDAITCLPAPPFSPVLRAST